MVSKSGVKTPVKPKAGGKKATDKGELVAPSGLGDLRGAGAIDKGLLDEAVAEINRLATAKGLETARALGEYVVQVFFGGKLERFRDGEAGHATWRALAERDDLQVSHSNLWSSVAILDQLRLLPDDVAGALPVSHHRRLLVVKDPETKLQLAQRAVDEHLTVKQFEAEVAQVRDQSRSGEKRGRKPVPTFVKAIRALPRLFDEVRPDDITASALGSMSKSDIDLLVATLEDQVAALDALREQIEKLRAEA